jgi:hypothetical protein
MTARHWRRDRINDQAVWVTEALGPNALAPTYINTPMVGRLATEGKIDIDRLWSRTPKWEIGQKRPTGTALKLLHLVQKNGLDIVAQS